MLPAPALPRLHCCGSLKSSLKIMLPYFGLDKVNDAGLAPLQSFNDQVEGNALKLADAAEKGDMVKAAGFVGNVTTGCVGCHQLFRGQPGVSPRLLNPAGAPAAK